MSKAPPTPELRAFVEAYRASQAAYDAMDDVEHNVEGKGVNCYCKPSSSDECHCETCHAHHDLNKVAWEKAGAAGLLTPDGKSTEVYWQAIEQWVYGRKPKLPVIFHCDDCDEDLDEDATIRYECGRCGTEFTREDADGHRCPDCGSFGSRVDGNACPHCETEVEEVEPEEEQEIMKKQATSWRDQYPVHPAAEMFPMMSDAEIDELAQDIKKNGLRNEIILWQDSEDQPQITRLGEVHPPVGPTYVLDGRNRIEALARIGKLPSLNKWEKAGTFRHVWGHETDPWAFVVSTNIQRRHLTVKQRRDIIARLLKANPERSDRATAKVAKADHKTVAAVREQVEASGEIPHIEPTKRVEASGRKARARKPKPYEQMAKLQRTAKAQQQAKADPKPEPAVAEEAPRVEEAPSVVNVDAPKATPRKTRAGRIYTCPDCKRQGPEAEFYKEDNDSPPL